MSKAFSLIELILVLVIIGMLLSLMKFYPKNSDLILGAKQIINDIAYTRSLALMQESFRQDIAKDEWFKSRWQLYFIRSKSATDNKQTYTIFLDKNGDGNANIGKTFINLDREIAVDILGANKLMNSGQSGVISKDDAKASKRFNIQDRFGITKVEFKGSCAGATRLVFDEFARLYSPLTKSQSPYEKSLAKKKEPCVIRLSNAKEEKICIVVDALSGFAYLPDFISQNEQMISFTRSQRLCSKL
ncbi:hypothetical protein DMB92_06965 [Campylobacter sp. MIT 99-7217]|uniref:pilus assembly FimT family protein n=1 Tax=Campylobacter sp. MIT 99-7217 TaxID=535091 RepID=UPI00115C282E|nr:type II secretion system protein [Campylobacter sp. MIT 99-7217]TQR30956.1 hypothetical protein DMB92_06965 [Campylobacter sp. MIT 99-7217]